MRVTYRRNPKVEEAPLQTDLMLFDPEKSQFFVLNPTMAFLWRHCDGEKSLDFIVESIGKEFADADGNPVETEMRQALAQLVDLGLVTTA
jgi:hypothetical protein